MKKHFKKLIFVFLIALSLNLSISAFSWASWIKQDLGSGGSYMYGVAVGDGRNDKVLRVYGANRDGHIY
ncbi:MAG: hypothetical protein QME40_03980, partial [bacterium]|nr:hypothetical protein [bacterium]